MAREIWVRTRHGRGIFSIAWRPPLPFPRVQGNLEDSLDIGQSLIDDSDDINIQGIAYRTVSWA
jgi:hypothetical protein